MNKNKNGFTIVELLIVIVVIGILAAITIVVYNGVQDRANNIAVQADLRNLASKVLEQTTLTGDYPQGAVHHRSLDGIASFPAAKNSYDTTVHNLYYCTGIIDGSYEFAVAAASKSGDKFKYTSMDGASMYTGPWDGGSVNCPGLGFVNGYSFAYGYHAVTQEWNLWAR